MRLSVDNCDYLHYEHFFFKLVICIKIDIVFIRIHVHSSFHFNSLLYFVLAGDPNSLCDSPSLVADQHRWTIFHSKVNLPAALNDPRLAKRESDFFTKTWGQDFVDTEVTPSFYLPQINKELFAPYQQDITQVMYQS